MTRSRADRRQLGLLRRDEKADSVWSVMRWCIPACRCVSKRLASLPLFPLIPNLCVCVCECACFKAAVPPEQIIYCFIAVYLCFIKTSTVSCAAVASALTEESDFDAAVSMLLQGEEHLFCLFVLLRYPELQRPRRKVIKGILCRNCSDCLQTQHSDFAPPQLSDTRRAVLSCTVLL